MPKKGPSGKLICENRKARLRFELLEQWECGIVLRGSEVKSLREKSVSLAEAYARIDDGELWLIGCHIAPYSHASTVNHDPLRRRKLLVHARELRRLRPQVEQKGLTLIPLRMHFSERGVAKVILALARGKTHRDKREAMKAREHRREMDRLLRRKGR